MKPARKARQKRAAAARTEHRAAKRSKYAAKKFTQATGKPPRPKTKAERRGVKPS